MKFFRPPDFGIWAGFVKPEMCKYRLQNMAENMEYHFKNNDLLCCDELAEDYYSKVERTASMPNFLSAISRYAPCLYQYLTQQADITEQS